MTMLNPSGPQSIWSHLGSLTKYQSFSGKVSCAISSFSDIFFTTQKRLKKSRAIHHNGFVDFNFFGSWRALYSCLHARSCNKSAHLSRACARVTMCKQFLRAHATRNFMCPRSNRSNRIMKSVIRLEKPSTWSFELPPLSSVIYYQNLPPVTYRYSKFASHKLLHAKMHPTRKGVIMGS